MSEIVKIHVKDLDFWYGSFQALKKISLDIPANEITALIGPSGCGKSTFLNTLNRMNDFVRGARVEGTAELDGADLLHGMDPMILRKRAGMVFQQPSPFPMSIYDNVAYGPRINGIHDKAALDEIVEHSLDQVGLLTEVKDRLKKDARGLSGGQQQRLCIARTIAVEPEVLLMDEPTSALDPIATARIEELILELGRSYTIVIVTHSMQQASRISSRTAFFYLGELIEFNPTEKLFATPEQKKTEEYITGHFS